MKNKREHERYGLSVITHFGPAGRVTQKSLGLTKNFSREGLSIETRDFNFTRNQHLELELRSPRGDAAVALKGQVVWIKKIHKSSIAGMKLIFQDINMQNEQMETLSSYMDPSTANILRGHDTDRKKKKEAAAALKTEQQDVPSEHTPEPGIKKQHLKKEECKVTFRLPREAVQDVQQVAIAGDFNDWDTTVTPMTRLKDGSFQISLNLPAGREYRFRYFIDNRRWENDWCADKYIPNDYGSDDSVVIV